MQVTIRNTKESLASTNTVHKTRDDGSFLKVAGYYFSKHKGKRRDRNGTNRKRGKTKKGKSEGSTEISATGSARQGAFELCAAEKASKVTPKYFYFFCISGNETCQRCTQMNWFYHHLLIAVGTMCSYSIENPRTYESLMDWKKPDVMRPKSWLITSHQKNNTTEAGSVFQSTTRICVPLRQCETRKPALLVEIKNV